MLVRAYITFRDIGRLAEGYNECFDRTRFIQEAGEYARYTEKMLNDLYERFPQLAPIAVIEEQLIFEHAYLNPPRGSSENSFGFGVRGSSKGADLYAIVGPAHVPVCSYRFDNGSSSMPHGDSRAPIIAQPAVLKQQPIIVQSPTVQPVATTSKQDSTTTAASTAQITVAHPTATICFATTDFSEAAEKAARVAACKQLTEQLSSSRMHDLPVFCETPGSHSVPVVASHDPVIAQVANPSKVAQIKPEASQQKLTHNTKLDLPGFIDYCKTHAGELGVDKMNALAFTSSEILARTEGHKNASGSNGYYVQSLVKTGLKLSTQAQIYQKNGQANVAEFLFDASKQWLEMASQTVDLLDTGIYNLGDVPAIVHTLNGCLDSISIDTLSEKQQQLTATVYATTPIASVALHLAKHGHPKEANQWLACANTIAQKVSVNLSQGVAHAKNILGVTDAFFVSVVHEAMKSIPVDNALIEGIIEIQKQCHPTFDWKSFEARRLAESRQLAAHEAQQDAARAHGHPSAAATGKFVAPFIRDAIIFAITKKIPNIHGLFPPPPPGTMHAITSEGLVVATSEVAAEVGTAAGKFAGYPLPISSAKLLQSSPVEPDKTGSTEEREALKSGKDAAEEMVGDKSAPVSFFYCTKCAKLYNQ